MTLTASHGPASARPAAPVQPISFSPAAIMARAHAYAAQRLAELAARPPCADPRTGAEILASIEAELAKPAQPQLGAPLPSLTSALACRREIFGPVDVIGDADKMSGEPADVDPIFSAIAELDRAADVFAAAWSEWTDILSTFDPTGSADWGYGAKIVRRRFGPTAGPALLAYQALVDGVDAAGEADTAAQAAFMATKPTSAFGVAAYRAAARRYAQRPTGSGADEAAMLARLDAMMAAAT